MIYYEDEEILIRNMEQKDAQIITKEEIAQGWNQTLEKYEMRLLHQKQAKSISLVAEYKGNIAGYINVYPDAISIPLINKGCAEIVDFGVLEKYRRKGIGSKLMDTAEKIAKTYSNIVCLEVGLHSGYGNAQRMYIKRGYLPDGTGVWYNNDRCIPYKNYCNDDNLVLYLYKEI